ncbi:MAG: hypothetical protein WC401_06510 [Bacteroidales bacterium]|jgi:hypothetical protein
MKMFLSASEFFSNIVDGLLSFWATIQNANWSEIAEQIKNWVLTGAGAGTIIVIISKIVPLLKNANAPILKELGKIGEALLIANTEIKKLKEENATLKDGVKATISYLETTAQVNLSSKVLSEEQKTLFKSAIDTLQSTETKLATHVANDIETIIADGIITADEAIALTEHEPIIKKALGTRIEDLMPPKA